MNRRIEYLENTSVVNDLQTPNCRKIVVVIDQKTRICYTGNLITNVNQHMAFLRDDVEEFIREEEEIEFQYWPHHLSI